MKKLLIALGASVFGLVGVANSATLDLTNRNFDSELTRTFTESGVNFTFDAVDNFVGGARLLGGDNGLLVGGGAGSSIEFTLQVSQNITLSGYGTNQGGGFALGAPIFDLTDGVTTLIDDGLINNPASTNIFNPSGENIVSVTGLSLALLAGTTYTFDINSVGAGVQGFFTSLEFQTSVVPLPAGLPLALTALGLLGLIGRRRRKSVA